MLPTVRIGHLYRHFKGGYYFVIDVIPDRTNDTETIVYMELQGDGKRHTRTRENFFDDVSDREENEHKQTTRFKLTMIF